jgi:hypothetical protein
MNCALCPLTGHSIRTNKCVRTIGALVSCAPVNFNVMSHKFALPVFISSRLVGVLLALISSTAAMGQTTDCELTYSQLQAEALGVLRDKFPAEKFEPGATADVIRMGEAEIGLQNLRSRFCIAPPLGTERRRAEMVAHFERSIPLAKNLQVAVPVTWSEARQLVRLQFMHVDYLRPFDGKKVLASRPYLPDVHLAVVIDRPTGYMYVREEDRLRWEVGEDELFECALKNVDTSQPDAKLQGGGKPNPFLASEEKDGYDAVRLLVPWIRAEAAKHLGDPFFAAIPNRDFLIMWGVQNSSRFQSRARENVSLDYRMQPYKLSPLVFRVWVDGRIEAAK